MSERRSRLGTGTAFPSLYIMTGGVSPIPELKKSVPPVHTAWSIPKVKQCTRRTCIIRVAYATRHRGGSSF